VTRAGADGAARLTLDDFRSSDPPMMRCLELAGIACRTDVPILVLGESGTGKTLLAGAIHNSSRRAKRPFVSFNAAALSDTLLDSQLFGHEAGAFTGARKDVRGKFELAHGGTLFIDEIADMSPLAQAKILRAVEYGEFERLGSERLRSADVRLLSATHHPLEKFLSSDLVRRDLFYRIRGISLTIPPLRERRRDLRALLASSVARAARAQGRTIKGLSAAAAEAFLSHPWPGNLRELGRAADIAVALTEGDVIEESAVLLDPVAGAAPAGDGDAPPPDDLSLAVAELHHVRRVLSAMGGNKARAARALGISRSRLDRKLAAASK
jgi:transcriptional regulator with PAS, ATPase and Fis domain